MANIDLLRRLVRQQTVSVGPVSNLIGPSAALANPVRVSYPADWMLLRIAGVSLPAGIDEFYATFSTAEQRLVVAAPASGGLVLVQHPEPSIFMLRGSTTAVDAMAVPFAISTYGGSGEFAVYVDGTQVRRGFGDREFTLLIPQGTHLIEVLVATTSFAVQLPETLPITSARELLAPPIWESVTVGYADPAAGTPSNLLRWYSDSRAGGWSVLRREIAIKGLIVTVGEADADGMFGLEIAGDAEAGITMQAALYAGFELVGTAADAFYDASQSVTYNAVTYNGITTIRAKLPAGLEASNPFWVGRGLGTGVFRELQRVARTSQDAVVEWQDVGIQVGVSYEYVLQAYGMFDPSSLSAYSDVEYARAGDTAAPASITVAATYPQVLDGRVSVVFRTPVDTDYAGVRTYFHAILATGTSPGGNTSSTIVLAVAPTGSMADCYVLLTGGTGVGATLPVLSNVGATLTMDGTWVTTPDATTTYAFYYRRAVVTDYGLPDTDDQFSFDRVLNADTTPRYGTYFFLAFDQAGNQQTDVDGVLWTYTTSDDSSVVTNQPPQVGIRQLAMAEQQAAFPSPSPYNDTLNYAVVELSGSDPVDGTTGVSLQYRRRDGTSGTATAGGTITLQDTTKTWVSNQWINYLVILTGGTGAGQSAVVTTNGVNQVTVAPAFTVVPDGTTTYDISWVAGLTATTPLVGADEPRAVRSRRVAVARAENENWIQARAQDADGIYSDALVYAPDFDNNPEFSSVVVRIDPLAARAYVTGSVDDDARSLEWWVSPVLFGDTSVPFVTPAPTTITNLEQTKDFTFNFDLPDGCRRTLMLRAWSGLGATGREGIDYVEDVYRTPRTTILIENKNTDGGLTAQASIATFVVSPTIVDAMASSTVTLATATTLRDTTKTWTNVAGVGQWAEVPNTYQVYFVRITAGTGAGQVRRITGSSGQQLTIAPDWTTIPSGATYVIQRGATLYRVLTGPATAEPFLTAAGAVPIVRTSMDQYIEFYSVVTGVPPEPTQRVMVDQDDVAEILSWTAVVTAANTLTVSVGTWDDDVRRWQLFAKKGGWPTLGAAAVTDAFDLDYRRVDVPITTATAVKFTAGAGTWYCILSPLNSLGEAGPRLSTTVVVTEDAAPTVESLSAFTVAANDGGGSIYNKITWTHSSNLASGTTHTAKVYAYRQDLGAGTEVEVTSGLTRYPRLDAGTGAGAYTNSDDDASGPALTGSILHQVAGYTRGGSTSYTWIYTIDLILSSGPTVIQSQTVSYTDTYTPVAPTASAAAASVINAGTCSSLA